MKKLIYSLIFLLITGFLLTNPELSLSYAALGLKLWLDKMVPALFPFMILSGIMIRMNLTETFTWILYPVVRPIFRVSKNVCYCMFVGFLCGFPMGAKTVADMYSLQKISKQEAEYLMAFVNNIGPIYFTGYVLPLLHKKLVIPYIAGMYLLPLLYGLILRYTLFSRDISKAEDFVSNPKFKNPVKAASVETYSLLKEIDTSIQSAVSSILSLGGYMILFNLLNIIPHALFQRPSFILAPLLEINGGLSLIADKMPLYVLLLLPFGGISCIAQTYSCIKDTDLKIGNYLVHKLFLTLLTTAYYLVWKLLSPAAFLM